MRNACAALACVVWLSACVTTKQTEKPAAPSILPQAADSTSTPAATEEPAAVAPDTAQATSDGDATPPCVAPGEKPKAKTKPKPKRIVVHQEAPAAPPTPPAAAPPADHAIDADLKLLNSSVESVLGRKVQGLQGEDFGRVVDLLADAAGRVRVAVLDYGGFLGVGNRRIAVEWSLLRADPEHPGEPLTLRITREKLQSAPAYKDSARPPRSWCRENVPLLVDKHQPASAQTAGEAGERGLDWFNLFVANIQTGFGPFIAVYLVSQNWTQTAIGLALSIGTVSSMASQVPAGAFVDRILNKTRIAAFSVLTFMISALMFAIYPIPLFVYLAEVFHGISSCTLGPAIAAMSLVLAGRYGMGLRLGRNARYAAIGNGVGAALMGLCGKFVSERAVFFLTAGLTLPALVALLPLRRVAIARPAQTPIGELAHASKGQVWRILADRRLLIFCVCALLFTFANAPMLMLVTGAVAAKGENANILVAACIVVPQVIVAVASPAVGRLTQLRGRRIAMLLGFAMLPIRAILFSLSTDPAFVVALQALDGIAAACFGILVPLVVSDVAARSGHFNLSLGVVGFAVGVGGTLSTPAAGWLADHYGIRIAFYGLTLIGIAAVLLVWLGMPETRPESEPDAAVPGVDTPGVATPGVATPGVATPHAAQPRHVG